MQGERPRLKWHGPAGGWLCTPREMESVKLVETRAGTSWETDHAAFKASRVAVQYRGKVKKVQSAPRNGSSLDMKTARVATYRVEQGGLGRGHPHLPAAFEPGEQCGPAGGVEVGGNLVEQQDRWRSALVGDQLGMGEDQAEKQRLLLAGRALRSAAVPSRA